MTNTTIEATPSLDGPGPSPATAPLPDGTRLGPLLRDHRVAELQLAARAPGTAMITLDCFDTLLWRRVRRPIDLFEVLGEELAAAGHLASHVTPVIFRRLRVEAEHTARRRKTDVGALPEVHLADIYRELPADLSDLSADDLCRAEIDLERRSTVADPLLAGVVTDLAREAGLALVVVSDFYFRAEDLRVLVDRPELGDIARAHIVTSADAGIGKESGLWRILPGQLGVAPDAIVHVGNNPRADLEAPRAAGVRTVFWADNTDHLRRVLEQESRRTVRPPRAATDDGVTALRGRAVFAGPAPAADPVAWETGTSVLGPVLAGYADWVQARTAELGIRRALCVMREGKLLQRVVDVATAGGPNPALRSALLWASREALVRASLAGRTLPEVEAILSEPSPATLERAAASLGVDLGTLPTFRELLTQVPHLQGDPAALHVFLDTLWQAPEQRQAVEAATERRRRNFVRYLRATFGDEPGDVALLDVGWRGSCQERLQTIIDEEGLGIRLHGLYLMADLCPDDRRLRGHRIEGYLPDPPSGHHADVERFRRNQCSLLELLLTSGDGMTLEVDDDGRPVVAPYQPSAHQAQQRQAVQDGALAYVESLHAYRDAYGWPTLGTVDPLAAEVILARLACEPTAEEAACFGGWEFEDDHDGLQRTPLVPAADEALLRRMTADQLHDQPWERVFWPAGALARWKAAPPEPAKGPLSPAGAVRLLLQRGPRLPQQSAIAYLHLADDGVSYATWSGDGTDLQQVTLMPTLVGGLLRVDAVRVWLCAANGNWRTAVWAWTAGDDAAHLQLADGHWLAPNLANCTPQSALTIRLPQPLPGRSQVEVELRGGFLAFTDGAARVTAGPDGSLHVAFHAG